LHQGPVDNYFFILTWSSLIKICLFDRKRISIKALIALGLGCQLSWWGRPGKCSHLISHAPLQVAESTCAFAVAWRRPAAALASDFLLLLLIFYSNHSFTTPTTHFLLLLRIYCSYYSFTAPTTHLLLLLLIHLLLLIFYSYYAFTAPTTHLLLLLLIYYSYYSFSPPTTHSLLQLLIFYSNYSFTTPTTHFLLLLLIHYSYYSFSTPTTHLLLLLLIYHSYNSLTTPTTHFLLLLLIFFYKHFNLKTYNFFFNNFLNLIRLKPDFFVHLHLIVLRKIFNFLLWKINFLLDHFILNFLKFLIF